MERRRKPMTKARKARRMMLKYAMKGVEFLMIFGIVTILCINF